MADLTEYLPLATSDDWAFKALPLLEARQLFLDERLRVEKDIDAVRMLQGASREVEFWRNVAGAAKAEAAETLEESESERGRDDTRTRFDRRFNAARDF